jgi:hypothetical protein
MLMTLLGRETPELPAEVLFSDIELRTLRAWVKKNTKLKPPVLLGEAVICVAKIGGYLGLIRRRDTSFSGKATERFSSCVSASLYWRTNEIVW